MKFFDPGGGSGDLFSCQVCKSMQFSLEGLKLGWLTTTSADRVLHCTSQATQDFSAKAAAFGLLTDFNGTGISHRIRFLDASNSANLKGKNVKMLDLPDISQESCDGFDQSCRREIVIQSCPGNVVITCAKECLEIVQPYTNVSQISDSTRILQGNRDQSALISPSQASSPNSSKDFVKCTTENSSATQADGTHVVLKDRPSFVRISLLSDTNEALSPEVEAPSTPDLKPEVKSLECKMKFPDCTNDTLSDKYFPEERKCSLQPGVGSHGPILVFEGTYNGQKGASHVRRQYGGMLPDETLFRSDEAVVRIQKVYRGYRIRKYCSQMHSAAISIQTSYRRWMVQKEYCSLKAIVLRMQEKVKAKQLHVQYRRHLGQAAILVQQVWRFHRLSGINNRLQQEDLLRVKACTTIQAHVRSYKARSILDQRHRAAAKIQHKWRDYQQKRQFKVEEDGAAQLLQSGWQCFGADRKAKGSEYMDMSEQEQAAIVLQAFTRGYLVRKCFALRRPGMPLCQSVQQSDLKTSNIGAHLALPVMEVWFNNVKLYEPVNAAFSKRKVASSVFNMPASCTSQDSGELGNAQLSMKQVHTCIFEKPDHYPNSEQCGAPSFSGLVRRDCEKKLDDWNDIPTDHLDECLDTCLAYLRPLPSPFCSGDWNLSHVHMTNDSITTAGTQMNTKSAVLEQDRGVSSHLKQEEAPELYPAWLSSEIKELSTRKGNICQRQSIEKLEHFAEVFLLHRHIVQQQRRAQDAPPFSPEILVQAACGKSTGSTSHAYIEPLQPKYNFRKVTGKIDDHQDRDPVLNWPSPVTEVSSKLVEGGIDQVPGGEVVVDIVGLLDHIDKVCCATECHDKVIHIDEDWYKTNTYTTAAAKCYHHTLTSNLSGQLVVPKVRAVLIVVLAMVVYTKMLCRGALVWAGRPHRNDEKR